MTDKFWGNLHDSHLLVFMFLSDPFPLSVGRTYDLLLTKRKTKWWWDINPVISLWDYNIYLSERHFFLCWLWRSKLPCCTLPYMTRGWGQPPADIQQGTWAHSLTTCKKLDVANHHGSLEAYPSLVKPQWHHSPDWHLDCSLVRPWSRRPSWVVLRLLTHWNCDMIHVCCFRQLHLE